MTTQTEICNRALQAIGTRSTISSLTDGSNEAINCAMLFNPTRQQLLRAARWNFADFMQQLSLLLAAPGTPENPTLPTNPIWVQGQMPPLPWLYEYAYPQDCLRVRRVIPQSLSTFPGVPLFSVPSGSGAFWSPNGPGTKFKVTTDRDAQNNQRTVVVTNTENAICEYTQDITNTVVFDPTFTEALVNAMAGKLALSLTGDKALASQKFQLANAQITQARADDANEGITIINSVPDWIRTRGFSADWFFDGPFASEPYGPMFLL